MSPRQETRTEELERDIPVGARVECADGPGGRSTFVVIDPKDPEVTHLVVRVERTPNVQYLVPLAEVRDTTPQVIRLHCTVDQLTAMPHFIDTEYIHGDAPLYAYAANEYVLWPYYDAPWPVLIPREHRHTPAGEQAVPRSAPVEATDGPVGRVDEFLVMPSGGRITHLVLRKGHLWGARDVFIPVSEIARVEHDTVYLKMTRDRIGKLPAVPVRR